MNPRAWMFVSDVDDTLSGDDEALAALTAVLQRERERVLLVLNSSRPCASVRRSLAEDPGLPTPQYLIGALGTEIENTVACEKLKEYDQTLEYNWPRDQVADLMERLGYDPHPPEFQTPFKASFDVPGADEYQRVVKRLESEGLEVKVIYSGDRNLDIIPIRAGKGAAIDFLRKRLDFDGDQVIVAGDSANDLDMFSPEYKGIIVANADRTLKALSGPNIYHARNPFAAGVLEGLQHWVVVPGRR